MHRLQAAYWNAYLLDIDMFFFQPSANSQHFAEFGSQLLTSTGAGSDANVAAGDAPSPSNDVTPACSPYFVRTQFAEQTN